MSTVKSDRIKELYDWLEHNKIQYSQIDTDVVEIPGLGKAYFQDTQRSTYNCIFRKDQAGELIFNSLVRPEELLNDGIEYIVFKFGDNFYYYNVNSTFTLNILKYVGERVPLQHNVPFVHLGVHTPFELLNGSFMPEEWIRKAKYLGHTALGVCDYNTMAACFIFQKECDAAGIKPVFGYSLTVDCGDYKFGAKVYVQTQRGFRNLLRIQKAIMVDNVEEKTISIEELLRRAEGNALVLDKYTPTSLRDNLDLIPTLTEVFDSIFYQVDLSEYKAERIDIRVLEAAKTYFHEWYKKAAMPRPILLSDSYYLDKDDAKNKIILNKVADGAAHEQSDDQYFKDADEHYALFEALFGDDWDVPAIFEECAKNTFHIANHAVGRMDTTRNYMPKYDLTPEEVKKYGTSHNMFTQLLEEGLQRLAPKNQIEKYRQQMEYEKYIIESTDNVDYLLVQYDTCNWARSNNIFVGCGRGSAAGSLLLYLLGITLIDPIKYGLIFERFLLPERAGLQPADTTIIGNDIDSKKYFALTLENGKTINVDYDAEFMVRRNDKTIRIYADELEEGDDIIFDNKDLLFTINEL
jgi:DNA polymerase-3 subunit alpha